MVARYCVHRDETRVTRVTRFFWQTARDTGWRVASLVLGPSSVDLEGAEHRVGLFAKTDLILNRATTL
jgi:hypothetical protein